MRRSIVTLPAIAVRRDRDPTLLLESLSALRLVVEALDDGAIAPLRNVALAHWFSPSAGLARGRNRAPDLD